MSRAAPTVVIVGDGAVAWLAARALSRLLPTEPGQVKLLVSPETGAPQGDAVALHPPVERWHEAMALDDAALVNRARGSFSHGAAMTGWGAGDDAWFQPFSTFGAPIGAIPFYPVVLRLRQAGAPVRLADYSMAALAAQADRFQRPGEEPGSVLSTCRYGLHVDRGGLRQVLRDAALAQGAEPVEGRLRELRRSESGDIIALELDDESTLTADLFIDASGPDAELRRRVDENSWVDWVGALPLRRHVSALSLEVGAPLPYRHLHASRGMVTERLPLHGAAWHSAWFDPSRFTDEQALTALARQTGAGAFESTHERQAEAGRAGMPWIHNCVSLGSAALVLEPLGADGFHFARRALQRLLGLLPAGGECAAVRREFNRQVGLEQDHARDFAIAHHHLAGARLAGASPPEAALPDSLAHRIGVFRSRGRITLGDEEPYEPDAWLALFDAMGVTPRQAGPLVDGLELDALVAHADKVRAFMLGALKTLPSHEDTLMSLHVAGGKLESTVESVTLARPEGRAPNHDNP